MNSSQVASRESTVAPNGSLGEPGDRLHENQLGPCVGTSDGTRRPAGVAPAGETALAVPFDNGQAPACLTYSPFIRANARLRGHPSSQSADPAGESLQVSAHIGIVDQNRWGRGHRQGVAGSNPVSPTEPMWCFRRSAAFSGDRVEELGTGSQRVRVLMCDLEAASVPVGPHEPYERRACLDGAGQFGGPMTL